MGIFLNRAHEPHFECCLVNRNFIHLSVVWGVVILITTVILAGGTILSHNFSIHFLKIQIIGSIKLYLETSWRNCLLKESSLERHVCRWSFPLTSKHQPHEPVRAKLKDSYLRKHQEESNGATVRSRRDVPHAPLGKIKPEFYNFKKFPFWSTFYKM